MKYETLVLGAEDGVATLELARGEALNTMTPAFWREMPAARSCSGDVASSSVGSGMRSPKIARNRRSIAEAAAPASCW